MSGVGVIFYKESNGAVPTIDFLDKLTVEARAKVNARLQLLEAHGHELRRPHCDNLGNGIYELRTRYFTVQYRLLYFFYGNQAIVISHGLTKEQKIPNEEIIRAIRCKQAFFADPIRHTHTPERRVL